MTVRLIPLVAVLSIGTPACAPEPPFRDGPSLPQDQYAEVNDVSLHYLDWGGSGRLLLLVPGLWHTAHTYDAIAPALVDDYRVVALTRREHGASSKNTGPITLDRLVDDLSDFIALFTSDPAIVVGQSFAGIELPRLAAEHPEKVAAIVLLDAVYEWTGWADDEQPPFPGAYEFADEYESFDSLDDWFESTYPEMWGESARAHLRSQTYLNRRGSVSWQFPWSDPLAAEFMDINAAWTPDEYASISVPVLSIQADFEGFFEANLATRGTHPAVLDTARTWARDLDAVLKRRGRELLVDAVPSAVLLEFEATHHWLHLQRPDEVVAAMLKFFDDGELR